MSKIPVKGKASSNPAIKKPLCESCGKHMDPGVACTLVRYDDETFDRVPYPEDADHNCHDCNCPPGGLHHPGCDMERCPKCSGQAISCPCNYEDDEDDPDDDEVAGTDDRDGLVVITKDMAKWLLPVLKEIKAPPKGLGPMFYHGLSYEKDLAHYHQALELIELIEDQVSKDEEDETGEG